MRLALIIIAGCLAISAPVYAVSGFHDHATAGMTLKVVWEPTPTPTVTPVPTATPTVTPTPTPHVKPKPHRKCYGYRGWHRHKVGWRVVWHKNKVCKPRQKPKPKQKSKPKPSEARPDHRGFAQATERQRDALRAAWRRARASRGLGSAGDVHDFYVARGGGTINRFAVGCVGRRGRSDVFGRAFQRVGMANRWRAVSDFDIHVVDADGEQRAADHAIPPAAYERLQNAVRFCAFDLAVPSLDPGADDQQDDD